MYEELIHKYTGQRLDVRALNKAGDPLIELVIRTARALDSAETELRARARRLRDLADKIESNLDAGHGDRIMQLNPLGEMQGGGSDVDRLISVRAMAIDCLQMLVHKMVRIAAGAETP